MPLEYIMLYQVETSPPISMTSLAALNHTAQAWVAEVGVTEINSEITFKKWPTAARHAFPKVK